MLRAVLALAFLASYAHAACPHMFSKDAARVAMPLDHPTIASRKLKATTTVTPEYITAMQALIQDLESIIGTCQFSLEGMAYNDNTNIVVNSSGVFFPAAAWLRTFFHDAGTFVKQPSKGGPKGGPNGSIGAGCLTSTCGNTNTPVNVTATTTCANGDKAAGGFSDGKYYCCPSATQCIAHGQSPNSGSTPGLTIPFCLTGNSTTNELCRRENDNLLPTIRFFRGRQANQTFWWGTPKRPVSLADIIVAGAVSVIKQCSGGQVTLAHSFGRPDALVADDTPLPSPSGIINQRHFEIFQQMGLNKNEMVTLVAGSHSIGGIRKFSSPDLTSCPFVPFDCTPAGQIKSPPFDNNVFKVACHGISGVTRGSCDWHDKCSNPSVDETANGCPFTGAARAEFAACNSTSYPSPGLASDVFWCQEPTTQAQMVKYAQDEDFFFRQYATMFNDMAFLGYSNSDLVTVGSRRIRRRRTAGN